jgi:hypothetical protein
MQPREVAMPLEEKFTWVSLVVGILVPIVYFATVLGQVGETPVEEIAYQRPLLIAIGASIALIIAGSIATAIGTAVVTAIGAEITGNGSAEESLEGFDRSDERDASISRRGDLIGFYASSVVLVGVLAITMLEYDYFWIANGLYLAFVISTVVAGIVKVLAYRRGF